MQLARALDNRTVMSPGDCDVLRGLVNAKILSKDANGALKDAPEAVLSPVVVLRFVHQTN